jgi:chromosome segregation protein
VHLKSLTLKGFKSFPDRTHLEFAPGVSVIVGPNGSGKSNVTDAVLWALGEQSPLAVRGQSMQDVIFGGARGQQARRAAEVELVIDNCDGAAGVELSEISILRRLDRSGEGEYRLNGARCRLVDVLETLSDTGLGKEGHSIVSQGRVEAVVSSKPRDRRLLVEEAAGLGKHRKRRRRAQLKLDRTQDNLDRALDVEREARSRLRPLKRQAEAAELHERLERQSVEARWELARDRARSVRAALAEAEAAAATARAARAEVEAELAEVASAREQAEGALAHRSEERERLSARAFAARSAHERVGLRLEQARATAAAGDERAQRLGQRLDALEAEAPPQDADAAGAERAAELEAELAALERERAAQLEEQMAELERRRAHAAERVAELDAVVDERRVALAAADARAEAARDARRRAEAEVESARRESASVGAELASVNQFLSARASAPADAPALADGLEVEPGYELAVAAALGGRLRAGLVDDVASGARLLDRAGADGGAALVVRAATAPGAPPSSVDPATPSPDAQPLAERVRGEGAAVDLARALLADTWLVERIEDAPESFGGVAVTRSGRAWFGAWGELRQAPAGGEDRVLAQRNLRRELVAATERAALAERAAAAAAEAAGDAVAAADAARVEADAALRAAVRDRDHAAEEARRAAWLIDQRRGAPDEGPAGARRAEIEAALGAERRLAEQARLAREAHARRVAAAREEIERLRALAPRVQRLVAAMAEAEAAIADHVSALSAELDADRATGEGLAAELRALAHREAGLQSRLRDHGEAVTVAEVAAQQARDQAADVEAELASLAERLELAPEPAPDALPEEERDALAARIERLARRREQLGPVNPLAKDEYAEAVAHVEELEAQRADLETALRELRSLIAETDRRIRESFEETFEAAAANFEELVQELFPGGRGQLRLVQEDAGPKRVLGGQEPPAGEAPGEASAEAEAEDEEDDEAPGEDLLGVEIEMTPAGKSMKRLSLLSGGEKSLTALAFLFAIFLARPCPFYVLDEVEAALDDLNIDRFLTLLRKYATRAQFIVVTHQKRTMEAADTLYGVSMGDDGVSRVISRRLPREDAAPAADAA